LLNLLKKITEILMKQIMMLNGRKVHISYSTVGYSFAIKYRTVDVESL